ncbi:MAG: MBL fold metallo-hydrolase, partial [Eubacterium sp.]|nr:MBL fold metallo-hydrolase [Eubacterium sp.]
MVERLHENPEIYRIDIPLKGNALKNLNCYVLKSCGESVVIDTGFNNPDCKEALDAGLAELGISMKHTNLLITHLHTDHCGLAPGFISEDSRIFMSKLEHDLVRKWRHRRYRREMDAVFRLEGFPGDALEEAAKRNPMIVYAADTDYDVVPLRNGDKIQIGDLTFTALAMSGHTP